MNHGESLMRLEYRVTRESLLADYHSRYPNSLRESADAYFPQLIVWWLMAILGMVVSIEAETQYAAWMFGVILTWSLYQSFPFRKIWMRSLESHFAQVPEKDVILEINGDGVTETAEEIVSFAPWRAVKGYRLSDGLLAMELAGGLEALIPEKEIRSGREHFKALVELLDSHGVPRRDTKPGR